MKKGFWIVLVSVFISAAKSDKASGYAKMPGVNSNVISCMPG